MITVTRKYRGKTVTIKQCNCKYHRDRTSLRLYVNGEYWGHYHNLGIALVDVYNRTKRRTKKTASR